MPLGIISDKDFELEIKNSNKEYKESTQKQTVDQNELEQPRTPEPEIITSVEILKSAGRNVGDLNVPESLRKIIGEESQISGRKSALNLASSFGISPSQVSSYSAGRNSPNANSNDALVDYLNGRKSKIAKRALNKLSLAISCIDEEALKGCEPKVLSSVAKDLSTVVGNMEPSVKNSEEKKDPVQFILYAPQVKNEHNYETVVAKDNY